MRRFSPYLSSASSDIASRIPGDVNAPQFKQAENLATRNLSGANLNGSPQLDRAMAANRASTMASAANETARIRSQFGRAGMSFSTGNQQAAQSAKAAAGAAASRDNAQTYFQNYAMERANQNAAPAQFAMAKAAPFNYLSQASGALMAPLSNQGNLLSALSSGGQVITPQTTQSLNPSLGSSIVNGWAGVVGNL